MSITAVLIDTCAYHNRQFDFSGIASAMIPTFLRLIESNHITLLRHPILDNEIKKDIRESLFVKRAQALCKNIKSCKNILKYRGGSYEDFLEAASPEEITQSLLSAYENFVSSATPLPYGIIEDVFDDYFNARPPFSSTGKKKSEFPDAFAIKGLLSYCQNNPNERVLVISDDSDWENALSDFQQIKIVKSLQEAMAFLWQQFSDKTEFVTNIWSQMIPKIMAEIAVEAEGESFAVKDIYDYDNIDITHIRTTNMIGDMTPLEVTDSSVLIHASASLAVDGSIMFLDENRSLWDKEDQCYYFTAYTLMSFQEADADIECEVRLNFPADGSMKNITIEDIKIINQWDIEIDVDEAETTFKDVTNYGGEDPLS